MSNLLHERENREDLQLHLKQNGEKFNKQCRHLMEEMKKGRKLTSAIIFDEWRYDSRRLRDCRQHRPDIVRSCWELDKNNNTKFMVFWIDQPITPSKQKSIEWATKFLDNLSQGEMFKQ